MRREDPVDGSMLEVRTDELLTRVLYRRDAWALPFAWDVPPCAPEVPLSPDRELRRLQHGRMLAEVWRRASTEHWPTASAIPLIGPVELRALGMYQDADDREAIDAWVAARKVEFLALAGHGVRADPGWRLWEALACERDCSITSVCVLPVMGDWLRLDRGVLRVSLQLYADPERFVDAAMAR